MRLWPELDFDSDGSSEEEDWIDDLEMYLEVYETLYNSRYLYERVAVPKQDNLSQTIFSETKHA
jgi:hypothetical protein